MPRRSRGTSYAHFLVFRPSLGEVERARFTEALAPADWTAATPTAVLSATWQHSSDAALTMRTLAWFPLLVTVGPDGPAGPPHCEAVDLLEAQVRHDNGRRYSDAELVRYLPKAQMRWRRGVAEQHRLTEAQRVQDTRQCGECGSRANSGASRCPGCGRRFTPHDDTARDAALARTTARLRSAERTLQHLTVGGALPADTANSLPMAPAPLPGSSGRHR